jgi:sec-independent protein translocase protein TatA
MIGNVLTPTHLMLVLLVSLLVLGPKRLPSAGRGLGEAMRGFKEALASSESSDTNDGRIAGDGRTTPASDITPALTTSLAPPAPDDESQSQAQSAG